MASEVRGKSFSGAVQEIDPHAEYVAAAGEHERIVQLLQTPLPAPTCVAIRDRSLALRNCEAHVYEAASRVRSLYVREGCDEALYPVVGTIERLRNAIYDREVADVSNRLFQLFRRGGREFGVGIRIGEIQIDERTYGIQVLPEMSRSGGSPFFSGSVTISLSLNGERSNTYISALNRVWSCGRRDWRRKNEISFIFTNRSLSLEGDETSMLDCSYLESKDRVRITNDRPVMKRLIQILMEIVARDESTLCCGMNHDDSFVFAAAGLGDVARYAEAIQAARAAGKIFPDYQDLGGSSICITKEDLDKTPDFGDGDRSTWRQRIEAHPILAGHGRFFPESWNFGDPFTELTERRRQIAHEVTQATPLIGVIASVVSRFLGAAQVMEA